MREEKSEEPIPLERMPGVREWRPDAIELEGECEARACPACRARWTADERSLGLVLPCPRCGVASRVLVAVGPFAASPIELVPAEPGAPADVPRAPVVPPRHLDPIDEHSPMVDAVARLQWIGGAFLLAVVIQQLGTLWKREHVAESEELSTYLTAATRLVLAALMFLAAGGLFARRKAAWAFGLVLSFAIVAVVAVLLRDRALGEAGFRARFDFGVLLEMPAFLIAVFSAVVLATPRYAAEFFRPSNQSGTMDVPTS